MSDQANVNININAKDNTSAVTKKVTMNLRDMGEKLQNLGMMATMAFTAPIVGGFALAVKSSKELQDALVPIKTEFGKIGSQLGKALIPLVREVTPGLIKLANSVVNLVKRFEALPIGTQKAIGGFLLFMAAVGPTLMFIGNIAKAVGTVQMLMTALPGATALASKGMIGFGTASKFALGEVALLVAAVYALVKLWNSPVADNAKKMLALSAGGFGLALGGDKLMNEWIIGAGKGMGVIGNTSSGSVSAGGGGGGAVNVIYAPTLSTGNKQELEQNLKPILESIQRQRNGRN
jgi:hypothetical protein